MNKFAVFYFVLLLWSKAFASQKLKHIGCVYAKNQTNWSLIEIFSNSEAFNLSPGESKFLTGSWTSEKPQGLNFALCTEMIGTDSNDSVIINTYRYQAKTFSSLAGENCSASGSDVKLLSKVSSEVTRGSFADVEIDWTPPYTEKLRVKEYFPRFDELGLSAELKEKICLELKP